MTFSSFLEFYGAINLIIHILLIAAMLRVSLSEIKRNKQRHA